MAPRAAGRTQTASGKPGEGKLALGSMVGGLDPASEPAKAEHGVLLDSDSEQGQCESHCIHLS